MEGQPILEQRAMFGGGGEGMRSGDAEREREGEERGKAPRCLPVRLDGEDRPDRPRVGAKVEPGKARHRAGQEHHRFPSPREPRDLIERLLDGARGLGLRERGDRASNDVPEHRGHQVAVGHAVEVVRDGDRDRLRRSARKAPLGARRRPRRPGRAPRRRCASRARRAPPSSKAASSTGRPAVPAKSAMARATSY